MTTIYLVRHTAVDVPKGICYGQTDVPLADSFEHESDLVLSKLNEVLGEMAAFQAAGTLQMWSSPLSRCYKLAEKISARWGEKHAEMSPQNLIINTHDALKELNFGDWENKSWDTADPDALAKWMADFLNVNTPNGENFRQLTKRATHFVSQLRGTAGVKVIFTHAGVVRALVADALGLPLSHAFRLDIAYGSIVKLSLQDDEAANRVKFL